MLYLVLIILATLLIALVNILCSAFGNPWWYSLVASILATIAVILVDGLVATIIRHLPEKWFSHENKCFDVPKKEIKFYEAIGIKKWKDLIPELGGFTNFHKNHVNEPNNPKYIERFLLEINYGHVLHFLGVPFGYLIMLLDYGIYMGRGITIGLTIGIPVATVNAILCLLPAFVLRYNYPRLQVMHKFALRKQNRKNDESNE
ncbi:MAG: hypothetical protein K6B64_06435 [Acholeplasmatales bacterium]|nr:hypothetical protein [Acholeplasmatales bacterium]